MHVSIKFVQVNGLTIVSKRIGDNGDRWINSQFEPEGMKKVDDARIPTGKKQTFMIQKFYRLENYQNSNNYKVAF